MLKFTSEIYRFKYACLQMQEMSLLDPNNLVHAFTISWLLQKCVSYQISKFILAWNEHPIPRSGIPSRALMNKKNFALAEGVLPSCDYALELYPTQLIEPSYFCQDVVPNEFKEDRNKKFEDLINKELEKIVSTTVNNNFIHFQNCFQQMILIVELYFA